MIYLKPTSFLEIQSFRADYQKKAKNYEPIPEVAEILGIYKSDELIGYFVCVCYKNGVVEINQGYLKPEARHKNLSRIAMTLLEKLAKEKGFKTMSLATNRAVGSYQSFMRSMGYSLVRAEFSKEVN